MAENDGLSGSDFAGTVYVPTASRRSTFMPPTGEYPAVVGQESAFTDFRPVDAAHSSDDLTDRPAEEPAEHAGSIPVVEGVGQTGLRLGEQPPAPVQLPDRPRRRSLQDDELVRTVTIDIQKPDSTLDAIEHFQAELQLRQQEAQDFATWEQRMRTIGTPEAFESIAEAIPEFTGVIPIIPAQLQPVQTQPPGQPAETALSDHLVVLPPRMPASEPEGTESVGFVSPIASPFDALLAGDDPESTMDDTDARPFPSLYAPLDAEPTLAGTDAILDDDVNEAHHALDALIGAFPVTAQGVVMVPPSMGSAATQPWSSPLLPEGDPAVIDGEPAKASLFSFELSMEEATPVDLRVGRAARMFWLWFATNSSLVSVAFGTALFGLGMSLRQAVLAVFIGVAISFLPLGLGTLAGKWSGQPTIVVSRATFGLIGNSVPAILALVTRLFWGAVLLWLVAVCTARILVSASLNGPFDEVQLGYLAAIVGFALAFPVALFGFRLFARVQLILTVVSGVLIIGLFAVTGHEVDIRTALTVPDGPWVLVVTGVVLVFSFIGLMWANSSGDFARYQRPSSSGASVALWASFGATLPAFLLIGYGALLAASNPEISGGLFTAPLDTLALMVPSWYSIPLLAATVLSLLSGVALSVYSGGFALRAVGLRLSRQWTIVVMGAALLAIAMLIIMTNVGMADVFRDLATSLAVPVAAWAGIFAAEVMIRHRRFDEESLLKPGGIYPSVNWVNLSMLVVASVVGFAFTSATVGWLSWQGYGFALFGFPLQGEVAASDLGVLVALVLGLLTPLVAGVSTVRQQESVTQ